MANNVEKILAQAIVFEKVATNSLVAEAKKTNKKLDPKAKVRNRGTVCVPAESAKDKKDHFPINDEAQARNALARVNQFSSVPEWYSGSLQSLVNLVARKVKAKYPKIEVSKDAKKPGKKKAYLDSFDRIIEKFAQGAEQDPAAAQARTDSLIQSIKAINSYKNLTPDQVKEQVQGYKDNALRNLKSNPPFITPLQWSSIEQAANAKLQEANTPAMPQPKAPAQPAARPAAKSNLPIREDVRAAQNVLYNAGFSEELGPTGVDGQLGPKTIAALRTYLPRMDTESAIKYLAEEYNNSLKPAATPAEPEKPQQPSSQFDQDPWATPKAPSTWGTG